MLKEKNSHWNEVELRDNRYDQIIHLVIKRNERTKIQFGAYMFFFFVQITAANGAEAFYTLENNSTRTESIEVARELDDKINKAWIGHPYLDVVDNCTEFDKKIARVLQVITQVF